MVAPSDSSSSTGDPGRLKVKQTQTNKQICQQTNKPANKQTNKPTNILVTWTKAQAISMTYRIWQGRSRGRFRIRRLWVWGWAGWIRLVDVGPGLTSVVDVGTGNIYWAHCLNRMVELPPMCFEPGQSYVLQVMSARSTG